MIAHGASRYTNDGCRCNICRRAWREYIQERKARRRASRVLVDGRWVAQLPAECHGKAHTYSNWLCQCRPCTDAHNAYYRDLRRRRAS